MARIRTVKPEFWEDETVGSLSREARLLFIASWNLADDEGLLRWTPAYVKASVFMYDDDVSESDATRVMGELEEAGLLFSYQGGRALAQRLAYVVNFHRHQRINRPQPGRHPPPSLQSQAVLQMYGRRDRWTCGICGQPVESDPVRWTTRKRVPSLDHLQPQSEGGSDYPSNLRLAHFSCNASRGTRSVSYSPSEYVKSSVSSSPPEGNGKEVELGTRNGKELEGKEQDLKPSLRERENGQKQRPSNDQMYLVHRLQDLDDRWDSVTPGALVKLNKLYGRPNVNTALGHLWEFKTVPKQSGYALLEVEAAKVAASGSVGKP